MRQRKNEIIRLTEICLNFEEKTMRQELMDLKTSILDKVDL
jgi:hypothetical protein